MSGEKKNFFVKHLWDLVNTLLAMFAVVIGLLNYYSDMPKLSQDIDMELLAINPNNSKGDMLIFTVDYSNTGKRPISLKEVECNLFIGKRSYKCFLFNPFIRESIERGDVFPLSVQPGTTKRIVLCFKLIKKHKGSDVVNNIKEIVSQKPEFILSPIDASGNRYPSKRRTLEAHEMRWDEIKEIEASVYK
ncbi:MAG: hypothetical protein GTO45_02415 [Candidatus Aminicenantes bacterium]|nr:hypothetical protein [Candidatus Aminicenantes bacterium]NIN16898.1 hypothetical protein [Candidatus Aminicenantes bacterium]NIN40791.1 hypothetical protein [Candidatus Aminicenantes bacterium]NIN83595.1 hypothetical protein [Candidatus Aminicenantes bacterium]NIO79490.1 hypothetical protein [Candidatus Aminicenantes bacterium]